jgi:hypothetical protein
VALLSAAYELGCFASLSARTCHLARLGLLDVAPTGLPRVSTVSSLIAPARGLRLRQLTKGAGYFDGLPRSGATPEEKQALQLRSLSVKRRHVQFALETTSCRSVILAVAKRSGKDGGSWPRPQYLVGHSRPPEHFAAGARRLILERKPTPHPIAGRSFRCSVQELDLPPEAPLGGVSKVAFAPPKFGAQSSLAAREEKMGRGVDDMGAQSSALDRVIKHPQERAQSWQMSTMLKSIGPFARC